LKLFQRFPPDVLSTFHMFRSVFVLRGKQEVMVSEGVGDGDVWDV